MRVQKCDVGKCFAAIVIAVVFTVNGSGESGQPIFYTSFDKGVNADNSIGLGPGVFNAKRNAPDFNQALASQKDPLLKLSPGLKGKGFLTGVDGQVVYYK